MQVNTITMDVGCRVSLQRLNIFLLLLCYLGNSLSLSRVYKGIWRLFLGLSVYEGSHKLRCIGTVSGRE